MSTHCGVSYAVMDIGTYLRLPEARAARLVLTPSKPLEVSGTRWSAECLLVGRF